MSVRSPASARGGASRRDSRLRPRKPRAESAATTDRPRKYARPGTLQTDASVWRVPGRAYFLGRSVVAADSALGFRGRRRLSRREAPPRALAGLLTDIAG